MTGLGADVPPGGTSGQAIRGRVARSSVLLWVVGLALRLNQFLVMLVLARLLLPEHYGVIALAAGAAKLIDVAVNVQVGQAIVRTRNLEPGHLNTAFTMNLLRGLIGGAIVAAAAWPLGDLFEDRAVTWAMLGLIPMVLARSLANPYFLLFSRRLEFAQDARRQLAAAGASAVLSIAFALVYPSYWALVLSLVVQAVVASALSWWRVPGRPGLGLSHWRELFAFGGWLTLGTILRAAGDRADIFLIGRVLDTAALGYYHVAGKVLDLASGDLVEPVRRALFPALALVQEDQARMLRGIWEMQSTLVALVLPIGIGLALVAEPAILVLLGERWHGSVWIVQVLAPVYGLTIFYLGADAAAMALGRTDLIFWRSAFRLAIRIGMMVGGWFLLGFLGILLARVATQLIISMLCVRMTRELLGGPRFMVLRHCWRSFVAALVMVGGVLVLPSAGLGDPLWLLVAAMAWTALAGVLFYVGAHLVLWQLAGRPPGAEARLIDYGAKALARLQQRLA